MDPHLDAERLAAFADGSLTRAERAAVEAHAADCGPCLQMLAAMARTEPAPPPSRWRPAVVLRWAVPLAAAATAVALWVDAGRAPRDELAAPRPATEAVPQDPRAASAQKSDAVAPAPPAGPARGTGTRRATDAIAEPAAPPSDRLRRDAPQQRKAGEQANAKDVVRQEEAARDREARTFADAPPAAAVPEGATAARLAAAAMPLEVVSPNPSSRWRMRGVLLEGSTDAGKTWTPRAEAFPGAWLAGVSPAPAVVWFVGRGGDVLIDAAGQVSRPRFPEPVDLVSVRAVSGSQADVTTADGRVFATTDGGLTWVLR